MAQSTSSLQRSSAQSSPAQSEHQTPAEVTVESLIAYLVAAKRSLNSIHNVHRANTIIAQGRSAVEATAAVVARTTFLRRSLQAQLKVLRNIHFDFASRAHVIKLEFDQVVQELDNADERLANTIDGLRATRIEDAFKAGREQELAAKGGNDKNTLHDFVEEQPIEVLKAEMKNVIDSAQDDQHEITKSIGAFEEDLSIINDLLLDKYADQSSNGSNIQQPQLCKILHILEDHAHEMASGLESLVKHFDLCVAAIKHTEGAGDAVMRTVRKGDLPQDVADEGLDGPTQPMTEEERLELFRVLEEDADMVDDVAMEIQDRNASMEAQLDKIIAWRERCDSAYGDVAEAFRLLETIGNMLTSQAADQTQHSSRWANHKSRIEDGITGMDELCETYDNFLIAYDRMIVEAARRRSAKKQMERIVDEAHAKLQQIHEMDLNERELFRSEQGDSLPSDIWHGLHSLPPRFAFQRVDEEPDCSIPELPRKTVDDALKRLKANMKHQQSSQ